MPAHPRSLQITDAYRARLLLLRRHAAAFVVADWRELMDIDDLDGSHAVWARRAAASLAAAQAAGVRLSAAYLAAFLRSELGRPVEPPAVEAGLIGVARTGAPLPDALRGPVVTVKQAIAGGTQPLEAAQQGARHAERLAAAEVAAAGLAALSAGMRRDPRIVGWRRVTGGGCGACLAAATGAIHRTSTVLPVHDHCRCVSEPVVAGVRERARRSTGREIFDAMDPAMQDARVGPQVARAIRSGDIDFHLLAGSSPMVAIPDQLTQRPLGDLMHQAQEA